MAIPSREIGWSGKANLLWQISKQIEYLTKVAGNIQINPISNGWSVVTGGLAGDGTVVQYSNTGFNITGPDDGDDNGWVYIKKYFPNGASLSIDYQWASVDESLSTDRPIYCIDATEPFGIPSDTTAKVGQTPEQGTWEITVPAGNWFSVGIYSSDSCCGRGFLSVDVIENTESNWVFTAGNTSIFPSNQDGYTLYEGGFTNNDDGDSNQSIPFAGTFYSDATPDTNYYLSTNGYFYGENAGQYIYGNQGDLYITPGDPLDDGDVQNFWYSNYTGTTRWRTSILVYCGHFGDQTNPYSYIINVYQDSQYQYIETVCKANLGDSAGPAGFTESASTETQVWQSPLDGSTWTYLGFGTIN